MSRSSNKRKMFLLRKANRRDRLLSFLNIKTYLGLFDRIKYENVSSQFSETNNRVTERLNILSNRKKFLLEERVRQEENRIKELLKKGLSIREEERRRLSRELHDNIGQLLTALKINLKLVQVDLKETPVEIKERIEEAIGLVEYTLSQFHQLTQELRLPSSEFADLDLSLKTLCNRFTEYTEISMVYTGCKVRNISKERALNIYRILQEALTNIAKHSHATKVQVCLKKDAEKIYLTVNDNGIGFRPFKDDIQKGIGITGMRERLEQFSGRLEIHSHPEKGTSIIAIIPREEEDDTSCDCG